jgi:hypothetical protein
MKHFSSEFLRDITEVPLSCVYAVISDVTKQCMILHSNNLPSRIRTVIDSSEVEGNDVRIEILEVLDDTEYKLLFCQEYKEKYIAAGYTIVSGRNYINYKVSVTYSRNAQKALVILYNRRRDRKIVGEFNSIVEAREFAKQYYGSGRVWPIYAIGENRYINKKRNLEPKTSLGSRY